MAEHHCHHHTNTNIEFFGLTEGGEWGLLINLLLMGFFGSFIHCVGMCGPFALSISQMRLMAIPSDKVNQSNKLMALFALPYYLGKATTYTLLAMCIYLLTDLLKGIPFINYIKISFLIIVALAFIVMGLNSSVNVGGGLIPKRFRWIINWIGRHTQSIGGQFGAKGFLTGMILGLIPCGLVIAAITQAINIGQNLAFIAAGIFIFGLSTVPGLFLISLAGNLILNKTSKVIFKILYAIVMFYNAFILVVYALKLL